MFTKKRLITVSVLLSMIVGIVLSFIVYTLTLQTSQIKKSDLYGTYQFSNRDALAIIPDEDDNTNECTYEWYDAYGKILYQGICKLDTNGFITFYVKEKNIAILFIAEKKYYFSDDSLELQKITKVSEDAIVSNSN